jgi:DNA (cytosine-5)-methyltransferase 1
MLISSSGTCARALTTSNQRIDYETETLIAHTLRADGFDASEDGTGRGTPLVAIADPNQPIAQTVALRGRKGGGSAELGGDTATALRASQGGGDKPYVLVASRANRSSSDVVAGPVTATYANTTSRGGNNGGALDNHAIEPSGVRRLLPLECERLQGFPDHFTAIAYRGAPAKDGPRYKAIGNSMAVPVIRWILERLEFVDALPSSTPQIDRMHEPVAAVLHDRALPASRVIEPDLDHGAGSQPVRTVEQVAPAREGGIVPCDQVDAGIGVSGRAHGGSVAWRA